MRRDRAKLDFELLHAYEGCGGPDTESGEVGDKSLVEGHRALLLDHSCESVNNTCVRVWATHESRLDYISWTGNNSGYKTSHKAGGEMQNDAVLHLRVLEKKLLELVVGGHLAHVHTDVSHHVGLNASVKSEKSFILIDLSINSHG